MSSSWLNGSACWSGRRNWVARRSGDEKEGQSKTLSRVPPVVFPWYSRAIGLSRSPPPTPPHPLMATLLLLCWSDWIPNMSSKVLRMYESASAAYHARKVEISFPGITPEGSPWNKYNGNWRSGMDPVRGTMDTRQMRRRMTKMSGKIPRW